MQREWYSGPRLIPGCVLFAWDRDFSLWGFTGSHSVVLLRSPKGDQEGGHAYPATRVDLVFKPVRALQIRRMYRGLTVQVASEERARQVLADVGRPEPDDVVLELLDADGSCGYLVCLAAGCHEDDGEWWEPSPFAVDLTDGRTPPWRTRVLGGAPDGDLAARFASLDDLRTALAEEPSSLTGGHHGRFLFVVLMRFVAADGEVCTAEPLAAFVSRNDAERYIDARGGTVEVTNGSRTERWIRAVPIDL